METWLKKYRYSKKKLEREHFQAIVMEDHRNKIIVQYKQELDKLKKRIKCIEQNLDGMGVRDYELTSEERLCYMGEK